MYSRVYIPLDDMHAISTQTQNILDCLLQKLHGMCQLLPVLNRLVLLYGNIEMKLPSSLLVFLSSWGRDSSNANGTFLSILSPLLDSNSRPCTAFHLWKTRPCRPPMHLGRTLLAWPWHRIACQYWPFLFSVKSKIIPRQLWTFPCVDFTGLTFPCPWTTSHGSCHSTWDRHTVISHHC